MLKTWPLIRTEGMGESRHYNHPTIYCDPPPVCRKCDGVVGYGPLVTNEHHS